MSTLFHNRALRWASLVVACGLTIASLAFAQSTCTITGVSSVCGGAAQLCGPDGNFSYAWTGPNGFTAGTQCIMAGDAGDYSLTITDLDTGAQTTCTHHLDVTPLPDATITGADSACVGSSIQLCGPAGLIYDWRNDQNVTIGTTQCINVTVAGTYFLFTKDPVTFCSGAPGIKKVHFSPCPPPPPPPSGNCPRTVGFWAAQCAQKLNGSTKFTVAQVTAIATCVDGHSAFFDWSADEMGGFCAVITPPKNMDIRKQTKRQYAGLLANICTGGLGLIANNGDKIQLDPTTPISCGGVSETIGDLIAQVEAVLAANENKDLSDTTVSNAYSAVEGCLDSINNGIGIGQTCVSAGGLSGSGNSGTMGSAFTGVDQGPVSFGRVTPNPFTTSMSLRYAIHDPQGADVEIGVFDLAGRQVSVLASGFQSAGVYEARWNGMRTDGTRASQGVYFIRGRVAGQTLLSRVLMVK